MDSLDPQVKGLLEKYRSHFSLQENGKILCSINGHTLPPRFDEVSKFIQGPKFQKLLKRHQAQDALQKYEPFIVQSKNFPLMLYCALTGQLMDKSVEAVKKHMQGKKFQRAKDRFTNDEIDLKPEPSLESFGVKLPKNEDVAAAGDSVEQQQGKRSKEKQQQPNKAAANGAAAATADEQGSDEEPAFWAPSDEGATDSEQEGDEESGSGDDEQQDGDDVDMDAEAGPAGDPMDEDGAPQQHIAVAAAASTKKQKAAAAAVGGKGSKQRQKQKQPEQSKPAGAKKKQNINRPSAAKKAKK